MQVAGPAVITQAAPHGQYIVKLGIGQISDHRKALQKPRVVPQYSGDLGLLEHDFRQPDTVRVAGVLPRQSAAAMRLLPGNNLLGKAAA